MQKGNGTRELFKNVSDPVVIVISLADNDYTSESQKSVCIQL